MCYLLILILLPSFSQVILRIVRRYYKFPIPAFLTQLVDNPIRRSIGVLLVHKNLLEETSR
ncbi:MAG: hypothetical protein JSW61_02315, partial [Candidatus Thorarchaeota archaeon]